jgi:hypothetical protein
MLLALRKNSQNKDVLTHVILADVLNVSTGAVIRTFSTAEQLIEWVKQQPGKSFKVVARQLGQEVAGGWPSDWYGDTFPPGVKANSPDIMCDRSIEFRDEKIQNAMSPGGHAGWG